uniref:DZF domain-containing protein n=1 Tax=Ciona savignyi TaxID=51511 RepID=H2ZG27_CIOSA
MSKRGRGNRPGDRDYGQRYADNYDGGYHDDFGARGARSNVEFAPSLLKLGKEKRYGFEMEKFKNMKTSTVRFPSYEVEHYLRDRSSQIQVGRAKKKRALTMNHCVLVMLKHLSRNLVNQAKEEEVAKTEASKATDEADSAPKTEKDKVECAQSDTDKVEADKKKADIVNEIIQEYGEKSENLIEIFQVTINEILESRKKEDKLKQQLQEEGLVHYVQESDAEEMADADMNEEKENVEAEELDYPEPEISPFKQLEGCDKEQRMIGVVGAGSANKKLMLQNVQHFENVVLFKHKVTKSFLNLFSSLFIETVRKEPKETARLKYYRINVDEENEVISIRNTDVANTVVDLRLSSTKYSETGESTSDEENPENGLNEKNCRDNLALIRRTRWFDRKMNKAPVKISVVRLFLAIKAKGDGWAAIPDWLIYYLVNIANDTGPYAVSGQTNDHVHPWIEILFHRTLEMISSGILLSKEHGFHDPCSENGLLTDTLTLQQLEEITIAAQRDLRKMAFSKHAEVLGPNEKVKS